MSNQGKRSKRGRRTAKPKKNYRTEKYVEYIFHAEVGILQAATLLPELTDGEVLDALRNPLRAPPRVLAVVLAAD